MSADLTLKIREDLDGHMFGKQAQAGVVASGADPTLKAAWHLDDLTDSSGNGHTLTNNGSATFVTGKIGNCVNLASASSQYLSLANHADINPGDTNWGIGLWFNPASSGADMTLFSKMDGATAATYDLTWKPTSSQLIFRIYNDSFVACGSITISSLTLNTGTWYCITCGVDAANDLIKMRINDGAMGSDSQATTGPMTDDGTVALTIGARDDPGLRAYTNGKIDAFHFWHKYLSAGEETAFYNSGSGVEYP